MEKVLAVHELVKSYGSLTAVDNLSFEVEKGEIFGLLGHNGAGKTTSIECILGVKKADHGAALIFGKNPRKERRHIFEKVGVQFQQTNYQDKIRVNEICQVTASLYREPADWEGLLDTFGLTEMKRKMVCRAVGRGTAEVVCASGFDPESGACFSGRTDYRPGCKGAPRCLEIPGGLEAAGTYYHAHVPLHG